MKYYEHFKNNADSHSNKRYRNQRGKGLGNWFQSIFRVISPMMIKYAIPVLQEGVKILGTDAIQTVANIANKINESANIILNKGKEQQNQIGTGKRKIKKRKINAKKKTKNVRRLKDIFD